MMKLSMMKREERQRGRDHFYHVFFDQDDLMRTVG